MKRERGTGLETSEGKIKRGKELNALLSFRLSAGKRGDAEEKKKEKVICCRILLFLLQGRKGRKGGMEEETREGEKGKKGARSIRRLLSQRPGRKGKNSKIGEGNKRKEKKRLRIPFSSPLGKKKEERRAAGVHSKKEKGRKKGGGRGPADSPHAPPPFLSAFLKEKKEESLGRLSVRNERRGRLGKKRRSPISFACCPMTQKERERKGGARGTRGGSRGRKGGKKSHDQDWDFIRGPEGEVRWGRRPILNTRGRKRIARSKITFFPGKKRRESNEKRRGGRQHEGRLTFLLLLSEA